MTEAVADQVEATLTAAMVDERCGLAVRSGLLVAALTGTGLDPADVAGAVARTRGARVRAPARAEEPPSRPDLHVVPDPESGLGRRSRRPRSGSPPRSPTSPGHRGARRAPGPRSPSSRRADPAPGRDRRAARQDRRAGVGRRGGRRRDLRGRGRPGRGRGGRHRGDPCPGRRPGGAGEAGAIPTDKWWFRAPRNDHLVGATPRPDQS